MNIKKTNKILTITLFLFIFFSTANAGPDYYVELDHSDEDYVDFGNMSGFMAGNSWTIIEKVKVPEWADHPGGWHMFRGKAWKDKQGDIAIRLRDDRSDDSIVVWLQGSGWGWDSLRMDNGTNGIYIHTDIWYTLAVVYNSTSNKYKLYVDGVKVVENSNIGPMDDSSNNNKLFFGGQDVDRSGYGDLYSEADMAIAHQAWIQRALTPTEITDYDGYVNPNSSDLFFSTDITSTGINDASGNGHDGTNGNSPEYVALVIDDDGDGYGSDVDCDDNNADIHPGANDVPEDGIDQDCNGIDSKWCYVDSDQDGYGTSVSISADDGTCDTSQQEAGVSGDCNDSDAAIYPGAGEVCDGVDNDCDGAVDEGGNTLCDNGLYCDGEESCDGEQGCQTGNPVDCSSFNLPEIATCTNDPDSNPLTWDFFTGFTSTCDEVLDACTTGTLDITHTCSVEKCDAECDENHECEKTECDNMDACYDGTYRDYRDVENACTDACECTQNKCTVYEEMITDNDEDGYDLECDNDCNDSNSSINPGAIEIPGNAVDENCDNKVLCDSTAEWRTHGHFVVCVTKESLKLYKQGKITREQRNDLIKKAAKSDVGKRLIHMFFRFLRRRFRR